MNAPPLALYAHFPWCVQKCPYCDFNSYTLKDPLPEDRYVETLLRDFDAAACRRRRTADRQRVSRRWHSQPVFAAAIGRLIEHVRRARLGFVDPIEITLEANPGTIERGRFADYRAAGVTRVSLGAQSFDQAPARNCSAAFIPPMRHAAPPRSCMPRGSPTSIST